jgi:hypothetical protein
MLEPENQIEAARGRSGGVVEDRTGPVCFYNWKDWGGSLVLFSNR